jgi:hypothetical protein
LLATANAAPFVSNCDVVYIEITNRSQQALDVTPLYVDAWSQTFFLPTYDGAEDYPLRLAPGQTRIVSYTEESAPVAGVAGAPRGPMHILLIDVASSENATQWHDFRYLAQRQPRASRSAGQEGFGRILDAAGYGAGTVRSAPTTDTDTGGALAISLTTAH